MYYEIPLISAGTTKSTMTPSACVMQIALMLVLRSQLALIYGDVICPAVYV